MSTAIYELEKNYLRNMGVNVNANNAFVQQVKPTVGDFFRPADAVLSQHPLHQQNTQWGNTSGEATGEIGLGLHLGMSFIA